MASGGQPIGGITQAGAQAACTLTESGTTTVSFFATDNQGNVEAMQTVVPIKIDRVKPTMNRPPKAKFVAVTRLLPTSIPVTIFNWNWSSDPGPSGGQSGFDRYWLRMTTDGGPLQNLTLASSNSTASVRYLEPSHTYQFQAHVVDKAGNTSLAAVGTPFTLELHQDDDPGIVYTGNWEPRNHTYASGGTTRASSQANATATLTFTGTSVALITTRGTDRGKLEVSIDGGPPVVVDLYRPALEGRRIVFTVNDLAPGIHTLTVRVLGQKHNSSTGFRVDIDAFAVLN
jgi:hypothetical protein